MENAGALWKWCWVGGRRNLAAFPLPTLLPQTESSLKSSCPVNSDFYSFNRSTKGFKGIQALWQHLRQEWESSRGTKAAASPDLQSGHCARCGACTYRQELKMLLFTSSWSVSLLKMRSRSENSEIWLPKCQGNCQLALALYLCLMRTGQSRRYQHARASNMWSKHHCKKHLQYCFFLFFPFTFPSFPLPLALFSKPRASEHIW